MASTIDLAQHNFRNRFRCTRCGQEANISYNADIAYRAVAFHIRCGCLDSPRSHMVNDEVLESAPTHVIHRAMDVAVIESLRSIPQGYSYLEYDSSVGARRPVMVRPESGGTYRVNLGPAEAVRDPHEGYTERDKEEDDMAAEMQAALAEVPKTQEATVKFSRMRQIRIRKIG